MDASSIYDKNFFDMHVPWRQEYKDIADILSKLLDFSSVLDLGCGNGFILASLKDHGKTVCGIDGSAHALETAPHELNEFLSLYDLTEPLYLGKFDLVICTEVAEHLDAQFSDILIDNICGNSKGLVYFTAATPGQGGYCHINEQPHSYWIQEFDERGFCLHHELTYSIRGELNKSVHDVWWFAQNSMIFCRLFDPLL